MIYSYSISKSKGTFIKTYVAKITGSHSQYGFARMFLRRETRDAEGQRSFFFDIGAHGVFERSVKLYSKQTNELISRKRIYFVYSRRKQYEIDRKDVLNCLFNLEAQHGKKLLKSRVA